jgi:hypothetical protein
MPDLDYDQIVSLKIDHAVDQRLGDHEVLWDLAGQKDVPVRLNKVRCRLGAHVRDHGGRRECLGMREAIEQGTEAKEVIAVAVGYQHGRK